MENVMGRFHHVGIAVMDFESVKPFYLSMGYSVQIEIYDAEQNVEVCVLKGNVGQPIIELLAPHNDKSPINTILKKNGPTPYHICYQVDDIRSSVDILKGQKFMVVAKPKISNAFQNKRVCFLWNKAVGVIELIEK